MAKRASKGKARPKAKARAKSAARRKPAAKRSAPARAAKPAQPKWLPAGYTQVTPYLTVNGAIAAIGFYAKAFGAKEVVRMPAQDGSRLMHAEIKIGASHVMLSDTFPEMGGSPAPSGDSSPVTVHLYVADVDATVRKAAAAGATVTMPPTDMFWGDRFGKVRDPFGHSWSIATHLRDVSPEEMEAAMKTMGS
jgi:uncharacterized glyoxalase superfamily protein PhnB